MVNIFQFLRLLTTVLAVLRLSVNPIETLLNRFRALCSALLFGRGADYCDSDYTVHQFIRIFPQKMKLAKVLPVYKTLDPGLFVNYRPISWLPNFSKFFEIVQCTTASLKKQNFFRNRSTRNHCRCFFFYLSKAFDPLDHQILFAKVEALRYSW